MQIKTHTLALPAALLLSLGLTACGGQVPITKSSASAGGDSSASSDTGLSDSSQAPSAPAGSEESSAANDEGTEIDVVDLQVGQCYNYTEGTVSSSISTVIVVDCNTPHTYEVFNNYDITAAEFPATEDAMDEQASMGCADAFQQYVGIPIRETTAYKPSYISPSQSTWDHGDRRLTCVLMDANGGQLTSSAKGAAK